ncbi:MAG: MFS transporter [Pseudomonadota bacterium]
MKTPLFFQRRFLPMWIGQSFGALADNMNRQILLIGVPFGAISLRGFDVGDAALPLIGALFPIAMLLGSMYGGQMAEKFETAMMFRRTKLAELALMIVAAFGLITGEGWFTVAALFGMGLQSALFNPVRQAAMPKYLSTDELIRGNGLCNAGLYGCILLGLGIGGYLIGLKPDGARIAAVTLVGFALAGVIAVRFAPPRPGTNPDLKIDWRGLPPTIAMFRFTFGEASVIRPLLGITLFYFISTCVTILLPIYCRDTLGADETVTTIIMLIFAVGALIGALTAAALSKGRSGLGYATLGVGLAALCVFGVYFCSLGFEPSVGPDFAGEALVAVNAATLFSSPRGISLGVLLGLTSLFMGIFLAPMQAAVQRRAPDDRRARILAVGNMLYAIAAFLGSLSVLNITEVDAVRAEHAFLAIGLMMLAVTVYMVRRRSALPAGLYDERLTAGTEPPVATPTDIPVPIAVKSAD